ncbi:MAG: hypothetical protein IJ852_04630 [Alphaproteobacteria bacterium]|nr:hypothetical protein [Alphaproteobacteria bacterium]
MNAKTYSGKVTFIRVNERAAYVRFEHKDEKFDFFLERQRFPVAWQVLMQIRENDVISVNVRAKNGGVPSDVQIEGVAEQPYTRIF